MLQITVTDRDSGGRLDKFLLKYFAAAPPPLIYRLLRQKKIKLNGRRAAGSELTRPGDGICVYLPEERLESMSAPLAGTHSAPLREAGVCTPMVGPRLSAAFKSGATARNTEAGLEKSILFEDANLLILNKPAGILCHGAKDSAPGETLIDMVLAYLAEKGEYDLAARSAFTPALCNRLDRNTGGIVVCGKSLAAVQEVCRAIAGEQAQKLYLAVVSGDIREPGVCESVYAKDDEANRAVVSEKSLDAGSSDYKTAVTEYAPLKYSAEWDATLVRARLVTGRSHQIRAHMRMIGRPIIGDAKYGDAAVNAGFRGEFGLKSQLLHARELRFRPDAFAPGCRLHAHNGARFVAPLPEKMDYIIKKIFGGM